MEYMIKLLYLSSMLTNHQTTSIEHEHKTTKDTFHNPN
jgi:hypothetical protein